MNIFHTQLQKTDSTFVIQYATQSLVVDPATVNRYQGLERYLAQPILAGLRPEAFFLTDANASRGHTIQVEVSTLEALGHEMIIYAKAPVPMIEVKSQNGPTPNEGQTQAYPVLVARIPSSRDIQTASRLTLGVDTSKLYLFAADGQAIPLVSSPNATPRHSRTMPLTHP